MYNKNDLIRCPFCGGEADIEIGADAVSVHKILKFYSKQ